jgi:hypothetical protein
MRDRPWNGDIKLEIELGLRQCNTLYDRLKGLSFIVCPVGNDINVFSRQVFYHFSYTSRFFVVAYEMSVWAQTQDPTTSTPQVAGITVMCYHAWPNV